MNVRTRIKQLLTGLLVAGSGVALAALFPQFGPVNGVLKGNASSPQTTAAVSADIRGLWSGTCDASTFLRGDGACATAGAGTVTSVGLSMPTGFSVAGSPITGSGSFSVTTTLNGPLRGNGSGFITGSTSLTTEVSGILPGANGGTNNGFLEFTGPNTTLKSFALPNTSATILTTNAAVTFAQGGTGLTSAADDTTLVSSGAAWVAAALPNCGSATQALAYNTGTNSFSCQTVTGTTSVANPTGTIGLTAVNGVATSAIRSDGAPALSQAIAPTWTAAHTFSLNSITAGPLAAVTVNSATPIVAWNESDQAANNRLWYCYPSTSVFTCVVNQDNIAQERNWLAVGRSNATITSLQFGNATDNPTYTTLGTGTTTHGGVVVINATSGIRYQLNNGGTRRAFIHLANGSNDFCTGISTNEPCFGWTTGSLHFTGNDGSSDAAQISATGVINAVTDVTVGGVSLCRSNGTNCPGGTTSSATFTATLTGVAGSVTGTARCSVANNIANVYLPSTLQGTSNATTMTVTGVPAACQPTNTQVVTVSRATNGGVSTQAVLAQPTAASGTMTFLVNGGASSWTNSGGKGFTDNVVVTYFIN